MSALPAGDVLARILARKVEEVAGRRARTPRAELAALVGNGDLKYRETVSQGLESAPEAFMGLLKGRNFGKQLVKLI